MATTAFVASTLANVGGAVEAQQQKKKAQRQQEKAAEIEQRKAAIQNQRERRRAAAQQQIQQSQIQASQAAQSGTTTGTDQTLGAIGSQTAGNISFQQHLSDLSSQQINRQQSASRAMGRANTAQAVGNLPSQLGVGPGSILSNTNAFGGFFNNNR